MKQPAKHLAHSWMLLLGIGIFAFGMVSGFVRRAEDITLGFTFPVVPHRIGRVLGASIAAGPVTIIVHTPTNPITYVMNLTEPISLYNLIRIAQIKTPLTADLQVQADGSIRFAAINGVAAANGQQWTARQNGILLTDFSDPLVMPGATIGFSLAYE